MTPRATSLPRPNIATGDKWTYGYDNLNEMTSAVEETSGSVVEKSIAYTYDIFGNLIQEAVTISSVTTTTRFAVDGWNPAESGLAAGGDNFNVWAVMNGSSSLTSRYIYGDGIDQPLGRVDVGISNTTYWELSDHLGSIRAVITNSGTVADSITYDAYGTLTDTTPSARGIFGYTGAYTDNATGLQLHGHAGRTRKRVAGCSRTPWASRRATRIYIGTSQMIPLMQRIPPATSLLSKAGTSWITKSCLD